MQELVIASCKDVLLRFENDDVQKTKLKKKKRSSSSIWTENSSIQTKNCVAALSMMASIVLGSLV